MITCFCDLPKSVQEELVCIADTLITPGKGILTADESISTMGKRLQEVGLQNSEEIRRKWRQLLFSTDYQISQYIAGVIVSEETFYQKDDTGKRLVEYLKDRCIVPGLKVDCGLVNLETSAEEEVVTQGLDNLGSRLEKYKMGGCEFARWRCVFKIGKRTPSYHALKSNSETMARFASICQSKRVCPVIEPHILPEGNHDINCCRKVTETVLTFVFRALHDHHVFLEGIILKCSVVASGMSQARDTSEDIAQATITALRRTVPPAVPGICFSSDGQSAEEAVSNLSAINRYKDMKPWRLTFAYGRALQSSALRLWKDNSENIKAAQNEFIKRAKAASSTLLEQFGKNIPMSSIPVYLTPDVAKMPWNSGNILRTPSFANSEWFDVRNSFRFTNSAPLDNIIASNPLATDSVSELSSVESTPNKNSKLNDSVRVGSNKSQVTSKMEPTAANINSDNISEISSVLRDKQ